MISVTWVTLIRDGVTFHPEIKFLRLAGMQVITMREDDQPDDVKF